MEAFPPYRGPCWCPSRHSVLTPPSLWAVLDPLRCSGPVTVNRGDNMGISSGYRDNIRTWGDHFFLGPYRLLLAIKQWPIAGTSRNCWSSIWEDHRSQWGIFQPWFWGGSFCCPVFAWAMSQNIFQWGNWQRRNFSFTTSRRSWYEVI